MEMKKQWLPSSCCKKREKQNRQRNPLKEDQRLENFDSMSFQSIDEVNWESVAWRIKSQRVLLQAEFSCLKFEYYELWTFFFSWKPYFYYKNMIFLILKKVYRPKSKNFCPKKKFIFDDDPIFFHLSHKLSISWKLKKSSLQK